MDKETMEFLKEFRQETNKQFIGLLLNIIILLYSVITHILLKPFFSVNYKYNRNSQSRNHNHAEND